MENWQLCPKCKGENYNTIYNVCNSTGLINNFTGLPPNKLLPIQGINTSYSQEIANSMRDTFKKVNKKIK